MFRDVVKRVANATVEKRDKIYLAETDQIVDLVAEGKSMADILGQVRLDHKKIEPGVLRQALKNIQIIQDTLFEVIQGTSFIFTPKLSDPVYDQDGNITTPAEPLWTAPSVPTLVTSTRTVLYKALKWDDRFVKEIYDVSTITEIKAHVDYTVNKIVKFQDKGTGTFAKLRTALLA